MIARIATLDAAHALVAALVAAWGALRQFPATGSGAVGALSAQLWRCASQHPKETSQQYFLYRVSHLPPYFWFESNEL